MKCYTNIIIYLTLLLFSSCSFLTKYSVLIKKESDHWEKSGTCEVCESFESFKTYKYKYNKSTNENLSISICPCTYGLAISFGPPLIPVIPNIVKLLKHNWKDRPFFVDMVFVNFNDKRVDLESVKFTFSKKNIALKADSIVLLSQRYAKKRELIRNSKEKSKQKISGNLYQSERDTIRLRFYFSFPMNKVKQLDIDFSNLQVNDNIVPFSKIEYVKKAGLYMILL